MPRKQVGEHSQNWELATRDEILFPKLSRKHKKMAKLIARAYDSLDSLYEHVAKILDENGIFGSYRLAYKAYAQELWRICQTYSGKARELEAEAVAVKYWLYGCDDKILYDIGKLFGLEVFKMLVEKFKEALEEAKTLKAPEIYQDPLKFEFEYDESGNIVKIIVTDKITGDVKTINLSYDEKGNLISVDEVRV